MAPVLNVSAYCFAPVAQPRELRDLLHGAAAARGLKGTILVAGEGINLFLAGPATDIDHLLGLVRAQAGFAGLEAKRSWSDDVPFRKLVAKVKREIIRMDRPAMVQKRHRAPALDARTLRRWLDQGHDDGGRPLALLDTRNAFEVDQGTFEGAIDWRLRRFSEFPAAATAHAGDLAGKTVVSFCTGGIRCEKAALVLREAGLDHVWQLDGGILKYFEDVGQTHFRGTCFVFDGREALDATLSPAPA